MNNIPIVFRCFKNFIANYNHKWFDKHQKEYKRTHLEFKKFLSEVRSHISLPNENVCDIQSEKRTCRFFRNTRFPPINFFIKIIWKNLLMQKERHSNKLNVRLLCVFYHR